MNSLGILIGQPVKVKCCIHENGTVKDSFTSGRVFAWSKDGERYLVRGQEFGWAWFETAEIVPKRKPVVDVSIN